MEERHVPPPTEDTIPALAAYLTYHSEWLGRHPAGDEAEDEIADAVANLETAHRSAQRDRVCREVPRMRGSDLRQGGAHGGDVHDTR